MTSTNVGRRGGNPHFWYRIHIHVVMIPLGSCWVMVIFYTVVPCTFEMRCWTVTHHHGAPQEVNEERSTVKELRDALAKTHAISANQVNHPNLDTWSGRLRRMPTAKVFKVWDEI